jgi:RNA polymerase sigma-70 factor (ECF subfamily)
VLRAFLTSDGDDLSIGRAAELLNMNEPAVRMAIHRLRMRYAAALRAEVSETVATQAEVEDEIRHLLSILSE